MEQHHNVTDSKNLSRPSGGSEFGSVFAPFGEFLEVTEMQLARLTQASVVDGRLLLLLGPQVLSGAVVVGHRYRGRASSCIAV